MAEYIEREAVQKSIADEQAVNHVSCGNAGYEIGYHNGLSMAMAMVLKAPAADVVAVVRCKECEIQQMCRLAQRLGDDGFCSEGERRGEDGY
jgi:hypothetical protein